MVQVEALYAKPSILVFCYWGCTSEREGAVNVGR